jgi:hypothetical protein
MRPTLPYCTPSRVVSRHLPPSVVRRAPDRLCCLSYHIILSLFMIIRLNRFLRLCTGHRRRQETIGCDYYCTHTHTIPTIKQNKHYFTRLIPRFDHLEFFVLFFFFFLLYDVNMCVGVYWRTRYPVRSRV